MPYETQIRRLAAYLARKAETEAHLPAANPASERFSSFHPDISGILQCPRCWIEHQKGSALAAIPGPNQEGVFKCSSCEFDVFMPLNE
jgi:hypothetical protein